MKFRERVSVICLYNDQILGFKAVDPHTGTPYFFLPGGAIEKGETNEDAAIREAREETGYDIEVFSESQFSLRYHFRWSGEGFDCLTHFYRARLAQDWHPVGPVHDQSYNKGPEWRPLENISEDFAYHPEILKAVRKLSHVY